MLTFLINEVLTAEQEVPGSNPGALDFKMLFHFLILKKMIKILTKIRVKITVIVVKNREPHYFIIVYKCKEVMLSLFPYQMLASYFDSDEQFIYYKVYG